MADKIKKSDLVLYNRRKQALAWLASTPGKYKLVQRKFRSLGYPSLEEMCEKSHGFATAGEANQEQIKLIHLLEECTKDVFGTYFGFEDLPATRIINNQQAIWQGMANCFPIKERKENVFGIELRFTMNYIALKGYLLNNSYSGTDDGNGAG
ncbi:MAG: hypothetical protein WA705_17170 [Candidatus Ozemobacteraceae bacterium]